MIEMRVVAAVCIYIEVYVLVLLVYNNTSSLQNYFTMAFFLQIKA